MSVRKMWGNNDQIGFNLVATINQIFKNFSRFRIEKDINKTVKDIAKINCKNKH